MNIVARPIWWAAGLAALLALALWTSYRSGRSAADARWQAAQADLAAAANRKLLAAVEKGIQASSDLHAALAQRTARYDQLERTFHDMRSRIRLVTAPPALPLIPRASGQAESTALDVAANPADGSARLSLAALWMWNSALAGRDVPAGSCGLADTSEAACAPDSGVSVDSAFANHELNARACAIDRLRYQHLIDFLRNRGAADGAR